MGTSPEPGGESSAGEESAWWSNSDEWVTFRGRVDERGAVAHDADVIGRYFDLYRFSCAPSVRFDWDHWSRCYIRCDHGEWFRDSHLVNFTEAFLLARREWLQGAHHPTWDDVDQ